MEGGTTPGGDEDTAPVTAAGPAQLSLLRTALTPSSEPQLGKPPGTEGDEGRTSVAERATPDAVPAVKAEPGLLEHPGSDVAEQKRPRKAARTAAAGAAAAVAAAAAAGGDSDDDIKVDGA